MTTKRMILMLLGCAIVFGGIFGLDAIGKKGMNQYFDTMPTPPQTISSTTAQRMLWPDQLDSVGTFSAINGTDIAAETDGVVQTIHFASGASVQKGALLVSLDSSLEQAQLSQLEAQARLARLGLKRRRDLLASKTISQAEFDTAEAETQAAEAAALAQRARLAKLQIKAPFSGRLGIRRVSLGQYVSQGTPLVTLQSLNPIEIEFAVAEKDLSRVRPDQTLNVQVDAYPEEEFTGRVNAIEPRVDAGTRMVRVRAVVDNPQERLRGGMFGRVSLRLSEAREVIAVPRTAIKYDPYGQSVFLVTPVAGQDDQSPAHVATHRFVRTGAARGDFLQIIEGLEAGDEVVSSGLLKLSNGAPLIINNEVTPAAQLTPPTSDS